MACVEIICLLLFVTALILNTLNFFHAGDPIKMSFSEGVTFLFLAYAMANIVWSWSLAKIFASLTCFLLGLMFVSIAVLEFFS